MTGQLAGMLPGPGFDAAGAGFVPALDPEGLQKARDILAEAGAQPECLDKAIDDVEMALVFFCLSDRTSWDEVAKSLKAQRRAVAALLDCLVAIDLSTGVRERELLRRSALACLPPAIDQQRATGLSKVDPLAERDYATVVSELLPRTAHRLHVLDTALAVLRAARPKGGKLKGGELHPLVYRLGDIWRDTTGGRPTTGSRKLSGPFPRFCWEAMCSLPLELTPDAVLVESTIRRLFTTKRTKPASRRRV